MARETHDDPLTATNNMFIFTVTQDTIVSYMYNIHVCIISWSVAQTNLSLHPTFKCGTTCTLYKPFYYQGAKFSQL